MNGYAAFTIPNIIDYLRILLLMGGISQKGINFAMLYGLSVSLDYFDGYVAKNFNQITLLGGALDMIIDRVSTMVILSKTAIEKPQYAFRCIYYSVIDFVSHFLFFVSAVYTKGHHKSFSDFFLMKIYYNTYFLYFVCIGSELCFIFLYLSKSKSRMLNVLQAIAGLKTFFHVAHFVIAIMKMSELDNNKA